MLFIEYHAVCCFIAPICAGTKFAADGHLSGETDDSDPNLVINEGIDRLVDITGIR